MQDLDKPKEMLKAEIIQGVTPEVLEGLRLYSQFSGQAFVEKAWSHFLADSSFGKSLSLVVKNSEQRMVAFTSILPCLSRVRGELTKTGKSEFLIVDSSYRQASLNSAPILVGMISEIYKAALCEGYRAIFAVPSEAASLAQLLVGAKPVRSSVCNYVHLNQLSFEGAHFKRKALTLGASILMSLAKRLPSRKKVFIESKKIEQLSDFSSSLTGLGPNELVASEPSVFSYLFANRLPLWRFKVEDRAELIFSKNMNSRFQLEYVNGNLNFPDDFLAVSRALLRSKEKCSGVVLSIPSRYLGKKSPSLMGGLFVKRSTQPRKTFVFSKEPQIISALTSELYDNHAHSGWLTPTSDES